MPSGINRGAILGVETVFSGTVGGAMAGRFCWDCLHRAQPSLLRSPRGALRDSTSAGTGVLRRLLKVDSAGDACLNLNFPDVPAKHSGPLTVTRQSLRS
jgi:5'-nucleotidase